MTLKFVAACQSILSCVAITELLKGPKTFVFSIFEPVESGEITLTVLPANHLSLVSGALFFFQAVSFELTLLQPYSFPGVASVNISASGKFP